LDGRDVDLHRERGRQSGGDKIEGNNVANVIEGGRGDDRLTGDHVEEHDNSEHDGGAIGNGKLRILWDHHAF